MRTTNTLLYVTYLQLGCRFHTVPDTEKLRGYCGNIEKWVVHRKGVELERGITEWHRAIPRRRRLDQKTEIEYDIVWGDSSQSQNIIMISISDSY